MHGTWIAEIHAGLAYAALAAGDPETAWRELETGRQKLIAELWTLPPDFGGDPLSLAEIKVLLSGAGATLIAYGDSSVLPPLCFVVHAGGEVAFAIEDEAVRAVLGEGSWNQAEGAELLDALLRDPWTRVPAASGRIFLQPPLELSGLPFGEVGPRTTPTATPGRALPLSLLPWSSMLGWSSAPRTRSGEGLALLGAADDDRLRLLLGGRPRLAPAPATQAEFVRAVARADVLHLRAEDQGSAEALAPSDAGLRLADAVLTAQEVADLEAAADLIILDPGRTPDADHTAVALLAAGVRSVVTFEPTLAPSELDALERELYLLLRSGMPRDEAVRRVARLGSPARPQGVVRLWGPGHLPVYALTSKQGLGGLLVSWLLFLIAGFFVFRYFVRRFLGRESGEGV